MEIENAPLSSMKEIFPQTNSSHILLGSKQLEGQAILDWGVCKVINSKVPNKVDILIHQMSLQTFESVALSLKMDNPASTRIQVSAFKLFSLVNTLPQKMHYVLLNRKLLCSIINLSYESTTNEDDSIIITARSLIITFFCWLTSIMSLMYFMGKWGFLETW